MDEVLKFFIGCLTDPASSWWACALSLPALLLVAGLFTFVVQWAINAANISFAKSGTEKDVPETPNPDNGQRLLIPDTAIEKQTNESAVTSQLEREKHSLLQEVKYLRELMNIKITRIQGITQIEPTHEESKFKIIENNIKELIEDNIRRKRNTREFNIAVIALIIGTGASYVFTKLV